MLLRQANDINLWTDARITAARTHMLAVPSKETA